MDAQDFRSLQEAYLDVYRQLDEREDSSYEKASDAALDARYGYGRATGDKRSFGRAANRSSAAAALRAIRRGERSGSGTSREAGADMVHQGWARTAKTSIDQTPEKKAKRAGLANTPYSQLPDDEKEKDRVSFDAIRATYNRNRNQKESYDIYDTILSHLLDEGYAETPEAAQVIMVNMSEEWREDIIEGALEITPQKRDFMQRQKAKLIDSGKIEQAGKVNAATYYTDVNASREKETKNRERGGNRQNPATKPDKRTYRSGGFSKKPEETERDYLDRRWDVAQYLKNKR